MGCLASIRKGCLKDSQSSLLFFYNHSEKISHRLEKLKQGSPFGDCCWALKKVFQTSQADPQSVITWGMILEDYLLRFFEDAKSHNDFVRLLKSSDEKKAASLLNELIDGAKVQLAEFRFSEASEKTIGQSLTVMDGVGVGVQSRFRSGAFHRSEAQIPVIKVTDSKGRFAFVGQIHTKENLFYLILAEVAPDFRREGLFRHLYKALCLYAFDEIGVSSIHGRAAIPRLSLFGEAAPASEDWRLMPELLWDELNTRVFRSTQLLHLWLMQANCYMRSAIDEVAGSDEFIIIKPELFQCLGQSERRKLEDAYPKPRTHSPFKLDFKSALEY
jgi:hypothetical protein